MNDSPSLLFALLQGLLAAAMLISPLLGMALFGGLLRVTWSDMLLALLTYPVLAIVSMAVFHPVELALADAASDALAVLRSLLIGGFALALGMLITQRRRLVRGSLAEAALRLGGAFLTGAAWGAIWGFSGWFLLTLGVSSNV